MAHGSAIKKTKAQGFKSNIVEFQVDKEINFPKICIVCGANSEDKYNKTIYGAYRANRDYKEDYNLNLPVCNRCKNNVYMKTGFSSLSFKLILIISLIGIIYAVILYFLTFSIFLSIGIVALSILIPYINYKAKTKNKVKMYNYIKVRLGDDKETLIFTFLNEDYSRYIDEINSKKEISENNPEETEKDKQNFK